MKDYQTLKKSLLKDKKIKKAYSELEPEFKVVEKFIEKRIEKGLSQAGLAQKVGTQQSAISRFESGTYNPSIQFLYKLADALEVKLKVTIS